MLLDQASQDEYLAIGVMEQNLGNEEAYCSQEVELVHALRTETQELKQELSHATVTTPDTKAVRGVTAQTAPPATAQTVFPQSSEDEAGEKAGKREVFGQVV